MSFISYAQNFEDVMLWRALKHISPGFYIDVGANDPTIDSVTKVFYDAGWRGINIEPLPLHHADLTRDRPRDINLMCSAGAVSGEIDLWECDVRGWATAEPEVVTQHLSDGHQGSFHRVPVRTLADICNEFASCDIHFLKIDVEGFEKAVLEGADFTRFRPWIIVIEATAPSSTREVHINWEHIIYSAGYEFAYADGLNRYYISQEHAELLDGLRYPPNVFDAFTSFAHSKALAAEVQANKLASEAEARAAQAEARAAQADAASAQHTADLVALHQSTSWKITAPLRSTKDAMTAVFGSSQTRQQQGSGLKSLVKRTYFFTRRMGVKIIRRQITWLKLLVGRSPFIFNIAKKIVDSSPGLKNFLARALGANGQHIDTPKFQGVVPIHDLAELPPRARNLYRRLRQNVGTDEASP